MSARPLEGQFALVTGANSGIGAGIARAFAGAGAAVAINYRSRPEDAQRLVDEIGAAGGRAMAVRADVGREREVLGMFDEMADVYGRIDIVVPNAGIQRDAPVAHLSAADWNEVLRVNLTGQFLCAREAVRRFHLQPPSGVSRARGKIICVSSVHEVIPWAGHANYAASKGGLALFMRTLAQEVAADGIRVNSIAPGAIETDINAKAWGPEQARRRLLELIPYGRTGSVEDVARAAVWLASDDSDYVVGTTLFVDGGMSLYPGFIGNG